MKLLVITENNSDFTTVLESCDTEVSVMKPERAIYEDISQFDAYCILTPGKYLDARLRERIETENIKGKRVFGEAIDSYRDIYSAPPKNTVRSRLIYVEPESMGIEGLKTGDILDDESNLMAEPYVLPEDTVPLFVYRQYIVAHTHTDMNREEILKDSKPGIWKCYGGTVMLTSFRFSNFNKARFAPRNAWVTLVSYIAEWLTGSKPAQMPESTVKYGAETDLSNRESFEEHRKTTIKKGLKWLEQFLVDNGNGGIREGLQHDIDPEGNQTLASIVRTDCSGECAGAFKMYASIFEKSSYAEIGENLERFVYGPMVVKGGLLDGMMRWTEQAWGVCYGDDVARAVLPTLYECLFSGNDKYFSQICRILDFLVETTAKDGTRVSRTDNIALNENSIAGYRATETGYNSAHYNSYYSAALLLAYKCGGDSRYLEVGKRGLETLMNLYPETVREQSETQEMCRLILPLAILYDVTKEEKHREMLYRVTNDLQKVKHPFGGYSEWDTGYKARRNRNSKDDECSILTENGDPVADLLYSCNFLPMGFAYAYFVTSDEYFYDLWRNIVEFFIRTQITSDNSLIDGSWCRAFDMDLVEAYAAPHDSGWATYSSETGWTSAEIIMGMMFMDIVKKYRK